MYNGCWATLPLLLNVTLLLEMACSTSSIPTLPPEYSFESKYTADIPSYSLEPLLGERRLEHNPGVIRRRIPTGTFQKCNSHIAILLPEQEDGASSPTYGRNARIRGEVFMKDRVDIFAVTVKVRVICLNFQSISPSAGRWIYEYW